MRWPGPGSIRRLNKENGFLGWFSRQVGQKPHHRPEAGRLLNLRHPVINRRESRKMGLFGSILKTGFDVVTSPIEVAKDVVTMGGVCVGEDETYTGKRLKRLAKETEEIDEELGEL